MWLGEAHCNLVVVPTEFETCAVKMVEKAGFFSRAGFLKEADWQFMAAPLTVLKLGDLNYKNF